VQSDFLTAYGEYLHNYEAATALLQHCLQDPSFDQFVKTLATSPDCEGLGLEDFLILPYQRITAYAHIFRVSHHTTAHAHARMLFGVNVCFMAQKLVKWTWESHADYGDITTVLHTVEKIISSNVHLRLLPSPHEKGSSSRTHARTRHAPPHTRVRTQLIGTRLTCNLRSVSRPGFALYATISLYEAQCA
jgi:hypothetical protein